MTSLRRTELQLQEAVRDRCRADDHLHEVVGVGLGCFGAVLLGERRRRQLGLLELESLLDQERAQRHSRRRRDPATARLDRRLRRQPALFQRVEPSPDLTLVEPESPSQVSEVGGAERDEEPVDGLLPIVEPDG